MARQMKRKKGVNNTAPSNINENNKRMSASEARNFFSQHANELTQINFEKAEEGLKLLTDLQRTPTKTTNAFSKEDVLTYLRNVGSNESRLRNLSWYLLYRSQLYRRLVIYNASMFNLDARSVIPNYSLTEDNNTDDILSSYYETLVTLDNMELRREMLKVYLTCFIQDVFYGVHFYDDTGFFIMPLPADYCQIKGRYMRGTYCFAMRMDYFTGTNEYMLELLGEPFQSMYKEYQKDTMNGRWQIVPEEYSCCLKYSAEDWQLHILPFMGLLPDLIQLEDVKDIQAIADAQAIYKLVWLELETITGSKNIDDWKVDPELAIKYFNRMLNEALPSYTSAAIVPGKLQTINFDDNDTNDVNRVSNATKNILNSGGGGQVLNSTELTGTTEVLTALKVDTEFAIASLLPQTQAYVNTFMHYYVSNPSKVKFLHASIYTQDDLKKSLLEAAQYSLPTKLAYNTLNGFSELDTLALNYLENEVLGLQDKFIYPLNSSFTSGSDEVSSGTTDPVTGGRPISDNTDLTDDGEASRTKRETARG